MSYDLFFRSRNGSITGDAFERYFSGRPHWKVDLPQAVYQNADTGVYCVLEFTDDVSDGEEERFDVALNVNYFRPSYFILEVEPEITSFVRHFDLVVSDPQIGGMGDGEYRPDLLLNGWNKGNEFGYKAIAKHQGMAGEVPHLPTVDLLGAWEWNFKRKALQERLGELTFVPGVMFFVVDGKPSTAAVWPDGIPIAVPKVDYFIVPRNELAPKKLFRRVEDRTVVSAEIALPLLAKYGRKDQGTLILDYVEPPPEIAKFIQALPKTALQITGVSADRMLNSELVANAV